MSIVILIDTIETRKSTKPPPSFWSEWGTWDQCSVTCGIGIERRTRNCSYGAPQESRRCPGKRSEIKNCDTKLTCPVDGGWTSWTPWKCTVTCGGGTGRNVRTCTNPKPMFGGKECEGLDEEEGACNKQLCPDQVYTLSPDTADAINFSLETSHYNFEKKEGDSVHLPCNSDGIARIYSEYPKSLLMWTRNGDILTKAIDRIAVTPKGLIISKLTPKDNGVYVCSINYAPGVTKPLSVSAVTAVSLKPDVVIREGQKMILLCHGAQLGKIFKNLTQVWVHNNIKAKDFGYDSPIERNRYNISTVTVNMTGKWVCEIKDNTNSRIWTTNVVLIKVLPAGNLFLNALLDTKNLIACIVIAVLLIFMFFGSYLAYKINKAKEEFLPEFEKWREIVAIENEKASSSLDLNDSAVFTDEETESYMTYSTKQEQVKLLRKL